ncbi:hypothetical protein HYZ97_04600 [Candidatus Pacearchaeota archaeon]|nr:hypothetical protein [Candidatus Pacearchaeota archaeon]
MAIGWILALVILVLVFVFLKFKEVRHKIGLFLTALTILFLLVSVGGLYASHELDLSTFDGVVEAGRLYVSWLSAFGSNIAQLSGYVVHQDWGLSNSTSMRK